MQARADELVVRGQTGSTHSTAQAITQAETIVSTLQALPPTIKAKIGYDGVFNALLSAKMNGSNVDLAQAALDKARAGVEAALEMDGLDAETREALQGLLGEVDEAARINANSMIDLNKKITLKYKPTSGVILETTRGKTTTILGTFKNDMEQIIGELGVNKSLDFGPRIGGFNVLNTPDLLYKSAQQFWDEYNRLWLDNAIARGDIILLATEPTYNVLYKVNKSTGKEELTGFGREYFYLIDHNYTYNPNTMQMIP